MKLLAKTISITKQTRKIGGDSNKPSRESEVNSVAYGEISRVFLKVEHDNVPKTNKHDITFFDIALDLIRYDLTKFELNNTD